MQISDLNKIVNLFLVGSLALTIVFMLSIDDLRQYLTAHPGFLGTQLTGSLAVIAGTFMALSGVMFVGCVIDGLSEIFIRSNLGRIVRVKALRKFFWVGQQYAHTELCRSRFNTLWRQSNKYNPIQGDGEQEGEIFASALFFRTAESSNVSWVVQHHAVHVLAADYIFLVLMLTIVLPVLSFISSYLGVLIKTLPLLWWALLFFSLYPLAHVALDRRLYTYEVAYRHGMLILSEKSANDSNDASS